MGFQNLATGPDLSFYAARSYSFDEATEEEPTLDLLLGEVGGRVVGPGRAELAAAVGPVGFNYYAKGLSWDAVRGSLISTA